MNITEQINLLESLRKGRELERRYIKRKDSKWNICQIQSGMDFTNYQYRLKPIPEEVYMKIIYGQMPIVCEKEVANAIAFFDEDHVLYDVKFMEKR